MRSLGMALDLTGARRPVARAVAVALARALARGRARRASAPIWVETSASINSASTHATDRRNTSACSDAISFVDHLGSGHPAVLGPSWCSSRQSLGRDRRFWGPRWPCSSRPPQAASTPRLPTRPRSVRGRDYVVSRQTTLARLRRPAGRAPRAALRNAMSAARLRGHAGARLRRNRATPETGTTERIYHSTTPPTSRR